MAIVSPHNLIEFPLLLIFQFRSSIPIISLHVRMDLINLYVKSVRDVSILTTFILIIPDCDNESNFYEEIQDALNQTYETRDLFDDTYLMIGAKPSYKVRNPALFCPRIILLVYSDNTWMWQYSRFNSGLYKGFYVARTNFTTSSKSIWTCWFPICQCAGVHQESLYDGFVLWEWTLCLLSKVYWRICTIGISNGRTRSSSPIDFWKIH